jgi:hypothetical protein
MDEALLAAITRIIVTDGLVKPRVDLRAKRRRHR